MILKIKFTLLIGIALIFRTSILFGQCNVSPIVTISGDSCIGSVLTVSSNIPASSIVWTFNGSTTVSTQLASLQSNATTVAGVNGGGSNANQLSNPDRICMDASGAIYVPDLSNNRIQKWLPGAISGVTVAGGNGVGSGANQFNRPTSVFLDKQGNIYVTDQNNGRVQKWVPGAAAGVTVAGGSLEYLSLPTDVFVDAQGNIYVSEQGNSAVKKWSPGATAGIIVAGGNGYGYGSNQLSAPTGIFVDGEGNIYVCDTDNNRVQKWAPGAISGVTVAGGNGYGSNQNQLANPLEIYIDCLGDIYLADFNNHRVQKWSPGATSGTTVAGNTSSGTGTNQFNGPIGIFMDAGNNLYVSDFYNHRVQKFTNSISKDYTALISGNYTATVVASCCSVTSNTITVMSSKTPQINISANTTTICQGATSIFTATPIHGGSDPSFQWKKNGINVGTNSNTYTDNTVANGDNINCVLTSNDKCLTSSTATSNNIILAVSRPLDLGPNLTICPNIEIVFNAGSDYTSYRWQDGSTNSTFTTSKEGIYYIDVLDVCGNNLSDTIMVSFFKIKTNFLPEDTLLCADENITLMPAGSFSEYLWSNNSSSPSLAIDQTGVYWLQVTDNNNCISRDSTIVKRKDCPPQGFYIANAFTPDKNGKNDTFKPMLYGNVKKFQFTVYNRYGQIVFTTKEEGRGWDGSLAGKLQDSNVFVWFCTYQFEGGVVLREKGTVIVIR